MQVNNFAPQPNIKSIYTYHFAMDHHKEENRILWPQAILIKVVLLSQGDVQQMASVYQKNLLWGNPANFCVFFLI